MFQVESPKKWYGVPFSAMLNIFHIFSTWVMVRPEIAIFHLRGDQGVKNHDFGSDHNLLKIVGKESAWPKTVPRIIFSTIRFKKLGKKVFEDQKNHQFWHLLVNFTIKNCEIRVKIFIVITVFGHELSHGNFLSYGN